MTEFRINCNNNTLTKKIPLELYKDYLNESALRNELVVYDTSHIDDYLDGVVFRSLRSYCSAPIKKIYLGQICDLFLNKQSVYSDETIPFDPFYDKYYSNKHCNKCKYKFIDAKSNFSYVRDDCFQYVYDWGEEFIYNIYVIDKRNNYNKYFMSRFIEGKTMCPPNDIGGMEAFKWILEKCHYNTVKTYVCVNNFKTVNDVYQWMSNTTNVYYKYACLMDKNNKTVRKALISALQQNYDTFHSGNRQKIINRLKSNKPFWFPYRELPNIQYFTDKLCTKYMMYWKNKLKKYEQKDRTCQFCGNSCWKTKYCSKCKCVMYCSRKCQKKDWISHKKSCF
eukprot:78511_1